MRSLVPVAALICLLPVSAFADSLDGHWCNENGTKRLHINGPSLMLPSGRQIEGAYRRHEFSYTVPFGEEGQGGEARMIQQSEEHMILLHPRSPDGWEDWRRCQPVS